MRDVRRLSRLLRVRTIGRDLAFAEEARAAEQARAGLNLVTRIDALRDSIAPERGQATAFDLAAAALYRSRLHDSALDARRRLSTAEALLEQRAAQRGEAQRDHRAIEKLTEAARAQEVRDEMRRLEQGPFGRERGTVFAGDGDEHG